MGFRQIRLISTLYFQAATHALNAIIVAFHMHSRIIYLRIYHW